MSNDKENENTSRARLYCSICRATYKGWGHDAMPVNPGRCCDTCSTMHVIPARIKLLKERKDNP